MASTHPGGLFTQSFLENDSTWWRCSFSTLKFYFEAAFSPLSKTKNHPNPTNPTATGASSTCRRQRELNEASAKA